MAPSLQRILGLGDNRVTLVLVELLPSDVPAAFFCIPSPPNCNVETAFWGRQFPRLARKQGKEEKVTSQDTPPCTFGCWQLPCPSGDMATDLMSRE